MLSRIPVWVPAILLLLLALGYRQSRTRSVSPSAAAVLALAMFFLSLYGVIAAFGPGVLSLTPWALGICLSAGLGRPWFAPQGMRRDPGESAVVVPGSWLPLSLMMGIFLAKFGLGYAVGAGLPVVHQPWFAPGLSLVFGALSGAFVARALAVRRFAQSASGNA